MITTTPISDLKSITDEIYDSVRRGRFTLAELEARLMDTSKQAVRSANNLVHEHPWEAIAVGVGAGVAAGLLIGRVTTSPSSHGQTAPASSSPLERQGASPHILQSTLLFVLSAIKAIQAFRAIKL
jgi:ElaB/YqjD/DUF883 family membrane-anchored ribosome-binding protein